MIMFPQPTANVMPLVTGQLCNLREHITMRRFKVYSSRLDHNKDELSSINGSKTELSLVDCNKIELSSENGNKSDLSLVNHRENEISTETERDVINKASTITANEPSLLPVATANSFPSHVLPEAPLGLPLSPSSLSPEDDLDAKYLSISDQCVKKLIAMSKEGVGEGWIEVGTYKEVYVMKKPPGRTGPPLNTVKGTCTVNAPPKFLLQLLMDPANSCKLDALLKELRVIHVISPAVSLVQLLYKPVWPTSARDLSTLSIAGQVDSETWISSGKSISDARIPPKKGYVRAELISGGYVIESVLHNPEMSRVTYVACVDLKGNIPTFAANKIAESQPMCVNSLRLMAEPRYQQMKRDTQKMAILEEKFPIYFVSEKDESFLTTADAIPSITDFSQSSCHLDHIHLETKNSKATFDAVEEQVRFTTPPIGSEDEQDSPGDTELKDETEKVAEFSELKDETEKVAEFSELKDETEKVAEFSELKDETEKVAEFSAPDSNGTSVKSSFQSPTTTKYLLPYNRMHSVEQSLVSAN